MYGSIAPADVWRLAALTGVGVGIMWALQMLGFGPSWIIATAGSLGVGVGVVYAAATIREPVPKPSYISTEFV